MAPSKSKSEPKANTRTITLDGKQYDVVREGLADIYNLTDALNKPDQEKDSDGSQTSAQSVFYNPIQQFNRDLSVLAIRVFTEDSSATRKAARDLTASRNSKQGERKARDESTNGKKRKRNSSVQEHGDHIQKHARMHKNEANGDTHHTPNGDTTAQTTEEVATNGADATTSDAGLDTVRQEGQEGQQQSGAQGATGEEHAGDKNGETDDQAVSAKNKPTAPDLQPLSPVGYRILDALSATGLRALRYAKEIPEVVSVTANDLSPSAIAAMKFNIQQNNLTSRIIPVIGDAVTHMYRTASATVPTKGNQKDRRVRYNVIDLDPYGTAAPFFDAALQALADGGLLCVTCTDAGVFASVGYLEKTFSQYGGLPWKGSQSHEAGIRLILQSIATTAARYGMAIEPLLSLSIDFYVRVFVRVRRSQQEVKLLAGKTMTVNNCDSGCGAWTTQFMARTSIRHNRLDVPIYKFTAGQSPQSNPLCEHCGQKTHLVGPMWGAPIHNPHFIQHILDLLPDLDPQTYPTIPRLEGMLTLARDETLLSPGADGTDQTPLSHAPYPFPRLQPHEVDHHPFFVIPSYLSKVIHCVSPSLDQLRGALLSLKYRCVRTHEKPGSLRTDAPWDVIWEVMREWVRKESPIKEDALKESSPGYLIMSRKRENWKLKNAELQLEAIFKKGCKNLPALKTEMEAFMFRLKNGMVDDEDEEDDKSGEEVGDPLERKRKRAKKLANLNISFAERLGRETEPKKIVRYQVNPRANWGPMNKAKPA